MKKGYTIENTFAQDMDELIVSNWPNQNLISIWKWYGVSDKESLGEYSIGKWKIKTLK